MEPQQCITNTVVISKLPKDKIGQIFDKLVQNDSSFKGLIQFSQIKFMRRILAIFDSADNANHAVPIIMSTVRELTQCNDIHIGFSLIDVKNINGKLEHLTLPATGKLLFVSPPPSPPNEWVDKLEEEPNKRIHYEDKFNEQLYSALSQVANDNKYIDSPSSPDEPTSVMIMPHNQNNPAIFVTKDP